MGIDFQLKSTIDETYNIELKENAQLKWAWRHIKWDKIFEIINFNIGLLFGNNPSYWSVDQVSYVFKQLELLHSENYSRFFISETVDEINEIIKNLKEDIEKLYLLFKEYVEKRCIINVW